MQTYNDVRTHFHIGTYITCTGRRIFVIRVHVLWYYHGYFFFDVSEMNSKVIVRTTYKMWLIDCILLKNERYMQMDMYIMIIFMTIWKYVPYASFLGIGSCWWNMLCLIVMFMPLGADYLPINYLYLYCLTNVFRMLENFFTHMESSPFCW